LGGTTVSALLAGTAIGFLIAHCHPGCVLELAAEAVFLVSFGALAAIAIGIGCLTGVISMSTVRKINEKSSDSIRLIINKIFGHLSNGSDRIPTSSELALMIENNICMLKITEDIWQNRVVLESIRRSVDTELKRLQEY
jgi:hypothetical protein